MSDKVQLIKEEIERRINEYKDWIGYQTDSNYLELKELLQFIDSLPEQPASEDLDDAARDYSLVIFRQNGVDMECVGPDSVSAFKAGAEWQKQRDLEDIFKSDMTMPNKFYEKGKVDAIKEMRETLQAEYEKGRFDMRDKMMKDAVEATILDVDAQTIEFGLWPEKLLDIKEGDKVKIIILKTE